MSIKKYIGDRAFYRSVLAIAVPIMIQNGITNLVNLLDNVMVGKLSTEAMSGVSIVNQFVFIFNLLIFGAVSAAGIFTAQYHGLGDTEGVRSTFRVKFLINCAAAVMSAAVFLLLDDQLISLFLHTSDSSGDLALTLEYGKKYLYVIVIGLLPYALSQVYASTMRETGETVVPMVGSIAAVATNFVLNYILIFGKLGAPALGVQGAAIATVVSRFAELAILAVWAHTHPDRCRYAPGAFRSFRIPRDLMKGVLLKGLPLMANEFLWATSMTIRNQYYSTRGLDVVAAQNIASTIVNVFSVVYLAIGTTISIIIGNMLGAGEIERAKDADKKLLAFSLFCGALMGGLIIVTAPFFPLLYNTYDSVRELASYMMTVTALFMPTYAFANAAYFTLRSGGKVIITFLFDSVFMWAIIIPVCFVCATFTDMDIRWLYFAGSAAEALKMVFALILLGRVGWARQLVCDSDTPDRG